MRIRYQAVDRSGMSTTAVIEAPSPEAALEQLRQEGLFPTEISEASGPAKAAHRRKPRSRLKNLANFSRHLQILISSGTPLTESLVIVERQTAEPGWHDCIRQVRERVEGGEALSVALSIRPDYFDGVCRNLVAAGEASGELSAMLDRLATLTRRQAKLHSTMIGAMVYPLLLCCVGLAVMLTLFLFVLPRFGDLFKTLDVPLPPTTTMLMSTGSFVTTYWWLILGIAIAGFFGFRAWTSTAKGKVAVQSTLFKLPKVGLLMRNMATARIARLLGVLVDSYVPLLDALGLVKLAAGSVMYEELIARAEDAVTRGEPMSGVFTGSKLVNSSVAEAIRNGERTGKLGTLLLHVADYLDEENEIILKALTSVVEPIILIVMGAFVGFVAVSMFLPLFDLVGIAQGGHK
jgi:type II secretory pathway component PulF